MLESSPGELSDILLKHPSGGSGLRITSDGQWVARQQSHTDISYFCYRIHFSGLHSDSHSNYTIRKCFPASEETDCSEVKLTSQMVSERETFRVYR